MFSQPEHFSFLTSSTDDPRPDLLDSLRNSIGNEGSILVYAKGFEEGILRDLAQSFPAYSDWVVQICDRLVDLLKPFSSFYYYHPSQKGNASLKRILPLIIGRGYEDLDINDGRIASLSFLSATFGNMLETEKTEVMKNLEEYCGRDTEGMIWIVDELRNLCGTSGH